MSDTPHALQQLGFTEYEARAYVALVSGGELNGYAMAKATGIPRANIYAVADKLVQRGAAHRIEQPSGVAYVAIAPIPLLHAIEVNQRKAMADARDALSRLSQRSDLPVVLNLRADDVLEYARKLIDAAATSLRIALRPTEAVLLAASLRQAHARGVVITTLCLEGCETECGGCAGTIHRLCLAASASTQWLLVVGDDRTALLGHLAETGVTGLLIEQPLAVELVSAYIQQSIALALLGGELGGRFDGLLSAQTRLLLDGLYPAGEFFAHMRKLSDATSSAT
ncbi:MAG: TrmB family transcriptional regulator [Rudaea sp.]